MEQVKNPVVEMKEYWFDLRNRRVLAKQKSVLEKRGRLSLQCNPDEMAAISSSTSLKNVITYGD